MSEEEIFEKIKLIAKEQNVPVIEKSVFDKYKKSFERHKKVVENIPEFLDFVKTYCIIRNNFNKDIKKKDKNDSFETMDVWCDWYLKQPKNCCYCGVSSESLKTIFTDENELWKNAARKNRGLRLEIERVDPKDSYNTKNCKFACYICNNAKSEFLSTEDFKPVAKGIAELWKNKGAKVDEK